MPVSGETILVKREVEEGGNTQAAMVLKKLGIIRQSSW